MGVQLMLSLSLRTLNVFLEDDFFSLTGDGSEAAALRGAAQGADGVYNLHFRLPINNRAEAYVFHLQLIEKF